MDKLLQRVKKQLEKHKDDENVIVNRYDLMILIQEFETGIKKRWNDERWD